MSIEYKVGDLSYDPNIYDGLRFIVKIVKFDIVSSRLLLRSLASHCKVNSLFF